MNTDEKIGYMIGCLQVTKDEMDHMAECVGLEPEDYKDSERCEKYWNYIKCTGMPNKSLVSQVLSHVKREQLEKPIKQITPVNDEMIDIAI